MIGIGLTLALLVAVYAGFLGFLQWSVGDTATLPLIGEVTWLKDLLTWSSFGLMLVLSVFLMVPVASAITSMFLDDVAQAVEDRLDSTTDTTMERADEASDVDADFETDTGAEFDTPAADAEVDVETDAELDTQPER